MLTVTRSFAAAGVLAVLAGTAVGQQDVFWANPFGGVWSIPGNWSPAVVPNNAGQNLFNATLALQQNPYQVILDIDVTIENFSLLWGGATLNLNSRNFVVNGNMAILGGAVIGGSNNSEFSADGEILIEDAFLMSAGTLRSNGSLVFGGTSQIDVCNTGVDHRGAGTMSWNGSASMSLDMGGSVTNGPESTFVIPPNSDKLATGDGTGVITNDGLLINGDGSRGVGGQTLFTNIAFVNNGTVSVDSGSLSLFTTNDLAPNQTLAQGVWNIRNGSSLDFGDSTFDTLAAEVNIVGANSNFQAAAQIREVLETGRFSVRGGKNFVAQDTFLNRGEIEVGPGSTFDTSKFGLGNLDGQDLFSGRFIVGGTLRTSAQSIQRIEADVVLDGKQGEILDINGRDALSSLNRIGQSGSLSLRKGGIVTIRQALVVENLLSIEGSDEASPDRVVLPDGTVDINGQVIFTPTSTLELIFNGREIDFYGQVVARSALAQPGSMLSLIVNPGVQLLLGDSFQLVDTPNFSGEFTNLVGLDLGTGLSFDIIQTGSGVRARVVPTLCAADLVPDGVLNFFDVAFFVQAFQAQNPLADFNGDGTFDFFDVSAFIVLFSRGCN